MNKVDISAEHQLGFDVVKTWPPVPVLGPGTISYYVADAKLQRVQAFKAAFKYLFTEPSPDELPNSVDDSRSLASTKSVGLGKLRNAQF
jgi:hypothetical protein